MKNNTKPEQVALMFNDCINNKKLKAIGNLMTEDHQFIDRDGNVHQPKSFMIEGWKQFFETYPLYENTFVHIQSEKNKVFITGYAFWNNEKPHDAVIWVATVKNNLVAVWQIFEDNEMNRKELGILHRQGSNTV